MPLIEAAAPLAPPLSATGALQALSQPAQIAARPLPTTGIDGLASEAELAHEARLAKASLPWSTEQIVVRPGDTVYVPSTAQSEWRIFFEGFRDVVSILSVIALLKVL